MGKLKQCGFIALTVLLILATLTGAVVFGWSNATNFVSHFLMDWMRKKSIRLLSFTILRSMRIWKRRKRIPGRSR